jgi:hypothetical protein
MSPYFYYLIKYPLYKAGVIKPDKPISLCFESLDKVSLRLPANYETDVLTGFRIVKRVLEKLFSKEAPFIDYSNSGNHSAIFDISHQQAELRGNYVEHFSGEQQDMLISKEGLISYNDSTGKLKAMAFVFLFSIPLTVASFFSKRKYHWPLLLMESVESDMLLRIVNKKRIAKLHYFCIYERDANLNAFLLMQKGIYVNKIPSEVPLAFWNRIIVSNCLSFCFAYQEEEYRVFSNTMNIGLTNLWGPELILNNINYLKGKHLEDYKYDVGFYSSGMWLRKLDNAIVIDDTSVESEKWLLEEIFKFCKMKGNSMRIYTHPIEKKIEKREKTLNHYKEYLNHEFVSIQDFEKGSNEEFDKVNICISLFSTLMFERLYCGFKTVLVPIGAKDFPLSGSSMKNLCVYNNAELFNILNECLNINSLEFFEKMNIRNYSPVFN